MHLQYKRYPLGELQTNAYILYTSDGGCVVIDPGGDEKKLIRQIENKSLVPQAIWLTHAHFDHIGAVEGLRKKWNIPLYVHEWENDWLTDSKNNGSAFFGLGKVETERGADHFLAHGDEVTCGGLTLRVIETPGHSPGSVSFYEQDTGVVFSGDALFQGSIGRTDLPGGNSKQLLQSIHDHLLTLPEDTVVCSGHGPETTIGTEMDINPFLHGF